MDVLFFAKKLLSACFLSFLPCWILLAVALVWKKYTRHILPAVIAVIWIAGISGSAILAYVGAEYSGFDAATLDKNRTYLVAVAGGGFRRSSQGGPESWFCDSFTIRGFEAGRAAQELMNYGISFRMCISVPGPEAYADKFLAACAFMKRFGVEPEKISIVDNAMDSEGEVAAFARYGMPVVMVSHRSHVPRLMFLAERYGVEAYAAPAGQPDITAGKLMKFLPSVKNLCDFETAVHEIAGLAAARMKAWLKQ